jgi:N-acetylglucosaminyldiphosphoundecaprenol N-acetyl-beta-D-mannosaminyltransferase
VIPKTNILGVGLSVTNMEMTLNMIEEWIRREEGQYVCVTGVHGVMESYRRPEIKQTHNAAGLVVPDGMPLVWLSRLRGYSHVSRVYGPDLMLAMCERSARYGYRNVFYGGAPGVGELLAERLLTRFPSLNTAGIYAPPFRPLTPEEDARYTAAIRRARPHIVWVGISTPKQESWMAEHVERLRPAVLIGVGAAFDFHAGLKAQAPKWMRRTGLEWLFRLIQEPARLGPRYLKNNPQFLGLMLLQLCRVRSQINRLGSSR